MILAATPTSLQRAHAPGGLTARRLVGVLGAFFVFLLAAIALALSVGSVELDWRQVFGDPKSTSATIFFVTRLPRVLVAVATGAALSVAGLTFQALLKNPLAEPFTLGVSSGASLGAMLAIKFGFDFVFLGIGAIPIAAFLAGLATIYFVYTLARSGAALPVSTLLLAGVTLSLFFGAIILFIHFLADYGESYQFIRWMMGSLDVTGFGTLTSILPLVTLGIGVLFLLARDLNLIAAGDLFAQSRGADLLKVQRLAFLGASLATGAVIAATGPIGFVGLIVPHILRLLVGSDHRLLMPSAVLFGGAFLVLCDTLARTLLAPVEIPVGVITAMVGGPFFMYLLRRQRSRVLFGGF